MVRLSPLDRKLVRDVWGMRGQALAIALVVASGVAMFVMYQSCFSSLLRTQRAFYERQRFADVFAGAKRVPESMAQRCAGIPGVAAIDTRVVADVTLDLPGIEVPARGRLISIPAAGRPRLNDVFLRRGRWIEPGRPDEVLASEAFANANHFEPGARLAAVINGRRRLLTMVGIALSPEYVYTIPPGEMIPDDRRYGILWMERKALASAFDMEGGFNDVALALMPGASKEEVIARLDHLLGPWGGRGAISRALQLSHWTLDNELAQLRYFGFLVPLIFFGVAAFILNVALTRALALQRPQIAALKALGYSNGELAWHYLKWALIIGGAGAPLGTAAGAWLGEVMMDLYNVYFRFPLLDYRLSLGVSLAAVASSLLMAALGAFTAVRRAVRIPPAEAMRPEPPVKYRPSIVERSPLGRRLTQGTRMVLRNTERQPLRALASVLGIAFGMAMLVISFAMVDCMDLLKEMQFSLVQRQDVTVTFVEPASERALHELARLPGVQRAEPMRAVAARLRSGPCYRNVAVMGLPEDATLNRVVDRSGRVVSLPPDGLLLSKKLAEVLGVTSGEIVTLEVLEGHRPVRTVQVARLVDELLGLSVYMDRDALSRLLKEGPSLSGAFLAVDSLRLPDLHRRLKRTPSVAGVSLTSVALKSFEDTMAANMSLMLWMNVCFAGIIAFGVVYNAARISLSERSHELATLRVLGFERGEISLILLGELALVTLLAVPVGGALGSGLTGLILSSLESEVYRLPIVMTPQAMARAALVTVAAATFSGFIVRRKLDRLDLIAVLKTRE